MRQKVKEILDHVASWPEEDQEELAELAREIEARRTGVYALSDEEQAAIDESRRQFARGEFLTEKDMKPYWRRFGVL